MAVLGLRFCARASSSRSKRGPLFIAMRGPLTIAAPPLQSPGSRRAGSAIVAHGPSCSAACGIFPDQSSNPCPLHWQADSQPLSHQGSPSGKVLLARFSRLSFDWKMITPLERSSCMIQCSHLKYLLRTIQSDSLSGNHLKCMTNRLHTMWFPLCNILEITKL